MNSGWSGEHAMRPLFLATAIVFGGSVLSIPVILLGDDAFVRKELVATYGRISKALTAGDIATFASYLAPDFKGKSVDGKDRNKNQTLEGIKQTVKSQPPDMKMNVVIDT